MSRAQWIVAGVVGVAFVATTIGVVQCQRNKERRAPGDPVAATFETSDDRTTIVVTDDVRKGRASSEARITTLDARTGAVISERFADNRAASATRCGDIAAGTDKLTFDGTNVRLGTRWAVGVRGCQAYRLVDDLVVIATDDPAARVIAVDASTGKMRWSFGHK